MKFFVQNHSGYPPNERGSAALDELIGDQEEAGADIVTDGLINWPDPFSAALHTVEGIETGLQGRCGSYPLLLPALRVVGPLRRTNPFALGDFSHARQIAKRPLKALVAGPYSLARIVAASQADASVPALAHAWAELIAAEVADLARSGATLIQIDESLLADHPEDIRLAREALEPVWAARAQAEIAVALPYANAEPVYAELNSIPADMLVLDVATSPGLLELITATGASKTLALGIADPHAVVPESVDDLCQAVEPLLRRYALETMHLCPAAGLMFVPRQRAHDTLWHLSQVANRLNGQTAA